MSSSRAAAHLLATATPMEIAAVSRQFRLGLVDDLRATPVRPGSAAAG